MTRTKRVTLAAYLVLSVVCLAAKHQPIDSLVRASWNWIWVAGPPIALIHGLGYSWVYGGGSVLVLASVVVARRTWQPRPEIALVCIAFAIVVWFVSGLLVYAPEV